MKTPKDFPPDTEVVSRANHSRKGVVISNKLRNPNQVAVDWESGSLERVNVSNLLSAQEMIEDEFNALQEVINLKLKQAAALVVEASELAKTKGKDLQSFDNNYNQLFDCNQLESAMDKAGWNTSSWHC